MLLNFILIITGEHHYANFTDEEGKAQKVKLLAQVVSNSQDSILEQSYYTNYGTLPQPCLNVYVYAHTYIKVYEYITYSYIHIYYLYTVLWHNVLKTDEHFSSDANLPYALFIS